MKNMNQLDCLLSEVSPVQLCIKPYFWSLLTWVESIPQKPISVLDAFIPDRPQVKTVAKCNPLLFVWDVYIWFILFRAGVRGKPQKQEAVGGVFEMIVDLHICLDVLFWNERREGWGTSRGGVLHNVA